MANAFWEEFKRLFKTKQQLTEERAQAVGEAAKQEEALVEALKQLEQEYNSTLPAETEPDYEKLFPSDSGLEKIDYTPKTDEQIRQEAEDVLRADYSEAQNKINTRAEENLQKITDEIARSEQDKQQAVDDIASSYLNLKNAASDEALKRGVQRSSIITERLKDYDLAAESARLDAIDKYDAAVTSLRGEIDALEKERQKSLDDLDLQYAGELTQKIAQLEEQSRALAKEAAEYNAEVDRKNAEYALQREKDIADYKQDLQEQKQKAAEQLAEYEKEYGYSGAKQDNYAKRYNMALEFYLTLSPDVAYDALEASGNMKYYLGNYYDTLKKVLKDRKDGVVRYKS